VTEQHHHEVDVAVDVAELVPNRHGEGPGELTIEQAEQVLPLAVSDDAHLVREAIGVLKEADTVGAAIFIDDLKVDQDSAAAHALPPPICASADLELGRPRWRLMKEVHNRAAIDQHPDKLAAMTPNPPQARLFTAPFGLIVAAHFLASLGFASMLLLPLYLEHLGATRATIGGLMAAAAVGGLVTRPFVAAALDMVGRKPTLALGMLLGAAGLGMVWFVEDTGPTAWAMRLLFGVGEGAMFSAFFTFVADIVPAERRTEGIALFGVSGLLPLAVSPLATTVGIDAPDLRWFLPLVGIVVAAAALFLLPLPETRVARPSGEMSLKGALKALSARPTWSVWLGTVLFSGMVTTVMAFATVVAAGRGVETPTGLWLTYAFGAAGVRVVGARLPDRLGPTNLVAPSLAVYALALVVVSSAETDGAFFLVGALAGLGHGYCFPVLTSQVVTRVADRYRGSGLSLFTALFGASGLAFSPALGALADRHGDDWMFAAAAVAVTAGIACWAVVEHGAGLASAAWESEAASGPSRSS